jgi:hypothetical protein
VGVREKAQDENGTDKNTTPMIRYITIRQNPSSPAQGNRWISFCSSVQPHRTRKETHSWSFHQRWPS